MKSLIALQCNGIRHLMLRSYGWIICLVLGKVSYYRPFSEQRVVLKCSLPPQKWCFLEAKLYSKYCKYISLRMRKILSVSNWHIFRVSMSKIFDTNKSHIYMITKTMIFTLLKLKQNEAKFLQLKKRWD